MWVQGATNPWLGVLWSCVLAAQPLGNGPNTMIWGKKEAKIGMAERLA